MIAPIRLTPAGSYIPSIPVFDAAAPDIDVYVGTLFAVTVIEDPAAISAPYQAEVLGDFPGFITPISSTYLPDDAGTSGVRRFLFRAGDIGGGHLRVFLPQSPELSSVTFRVSVSPFGGGVSP